MASTASRGRVGEVAEQVHVVDAREGARQVGVDEGQGARQVSMPTLMKIPGASLMLSRAA